MVHGRLWPTAPVPAAEFHRTLYPAPQLDASAWADPSVGARAGTMVCWVGQTDGHRRREVATQASVDIPSGDLWDMATVDHVLRDLDFGGSRGDARQRLDARAKTALVTARYGATNGADFYNDLRETIQTGVDARGRRIHNLAAFVTQACEEFALKGWYPETIARRVRHGRAPNYRGPAPVPRAPAPVHQHAAPAAQYATPVPQQSTSSGLSPAERASLTEAVIQLATVDVRRSERPPEEEYLYDHFNQATVGPPLDAPFHIFNDAAVADVKAPPPQLPAQAAVHQLPIKAPPPNVPPERHVAVAPLPNQGAAEAAVPVRQRWADANPADDAAAHYAGLQGVVATVPKFKPPPAAYRGVTAARPPAQADVGRAQMPPAAPPYVDYRAGRAGRLGGAPAGVPIATPVPPAAMFPAASAPTPVIRLPEATRSPRPSHIAQAISHFVDMAPSNSVLDIRNVSGPDGMRTTTVQLQMRTTTVQPAQPPANATAGGWWHPSVYGSEWDGDERRP